MKKLDEQVRINQIVRELRSVCWGGLDQRGRRLQVEGQSRVGWVRRRGVLFCCLEICLYSCFYWIGRVWFIESSFFQFYVFRSFVQYVFVVERGQADLSGVLRMRRVGVVYIDRGRSEWGCDEWIFMVGGESVSDSEGNQIVWGGRGLFQRI